MYRKTLHFLQERVTTYLGARKGEQKVPTGNKGWLGKKQGTKGASVREYVVPVHCPQGCEKQTVLSEG